jgi:hypothetical protein
MCYAILAAVGASYVIIVVWMVQHFPARSELKMLLPLGVCIGLVTAGMAMLAFLARNAAGC